MTRIEALKLLGLSNAATPLTADIVMEAFRAAVRANHPDSKSDPRLHPAIDLRDSPQADIHQLTVAKKILLAQLTDADSACKLCGGVGMVRSQMGYRACVACKGTGDRK